MSRQDVMTHYGAYLYRREDYLAICDGNECAAQILDLFEYWTAGRVSEIKQIRNYNASAAKHGGRKREEQDLWLYETVADFQEGLLNSFSDKPIRTALKFLAAKDFISSKPSKIPQDRTKMYRLNVPSVQAAIEVWATNNDKKRLEILAQTETVELPPQTVELPPLYINNQENYQGNYHVNTHNHERVCETEKDLDSFSEPDWDAIGKETEAEQAEYLATNVEEKVRVYRVADKTTREDQRSAAAASSQNSDNVKCWICSFPEEPIRPFRRLPRISLAVADDILHGNPSTRLLNRLRRRPEANAS